MALRTDVARAAYSTLLRFGLPLYLARLWWRGAKEPAYRAHLGERLGFYDGSGSEDGGGRGRLWLHAVSLGETRAAAALVSELRALVPGLKVLLTTSTATGFEAGRALLQAGDAQVWLPYDTPGAVRRFLRAQRPAIGVVMETEVWPNLLEGAQRAGLPMVLANARLSERSRAKGQRLAALMHPAMASFTRVLAQSDDDAVRLRASGAACVQVVGNLKYDLTPAPELLARGAAWHTAVDRPVVLAAVTREGEEALLLEAWRDVAQPRPLLLIVPRHPPRFDEVAGLIAQAGFTLQRRSTWADAPPADAGHADVWLGDSLSEMPLYYAVADVALLGGSFAPLGGQNLIEAAACGCPLVMGPHTFNFAEAAELSLAAGAAKRVADLPTAVSAAVQIATSPERAAMSAHALAFAARHRGAAARLAREIAAVMPH